MRRSAPAIGWGLLAAAALAAAAGPTLIQLGFAVVAIGVIGMAHGASDLAVVARSRRASFLALYAIVSLTCLLWWSVAPTVALPLFLIASAVHFAAEDSSGISRTYRCALGVGLITIPAVFHAQDYGALLSYAAGISIPAPIRLALVIMGISASILLLIRATRHRNMTLPIMIAALLILPPLIGFSLGFLVLHALPQTNARRRMLGCATYGAYLRVTGPILLAAILLAGLVAVIFVRVEPNGVRALFACITALAMPHLLVTPMFSRDSYFDDAAVGTINRRGATPGLIGQ